MVVTKVADSAVIMPNKKIDITNSHELSEKLTDLYEAGVKNITIDFTHVCSIDCSGLGKLLLSQKKLKESQGGLRIINVSSFICAQVFSPGAAGKSNSPGKHLLILKETPVFSQLAGGILILAGLFYACSRDIFIR
ncbi:MAG: STAS domain-containing protein [Bacillota bacterium]